MWPFASKKTALVALTNTLTGKKEPFVSRIAGKASLYSCGPTVYGAIHIGNLRSFILSDLVARTLTESGYKVSRVMNITDVGHLVGDGDDGEDKMQVGAKKESTTPEAIAERYTELFLKHIQELNINTKEIRFPRATGYIKEQLKMIGALEKKGLTYTLADGVYFDTEKFGHYGLLGNLKDVAMRAGARVEMVSGKKNAHDFALWRFAKPNDLQKWNSPWGIGNPGWSIECSAMATTLLGDEIDIHTGGEDLASVHHNNEIAQSEGATGKKFVRTWVHGAFLNMAGEKISKSIGNTVTLADVTEQNIDAMALRYFFLQGHYRTPLSFTWEALKAANEALMRLRKLSDEINRASGGRARKSAADETFASFMRDDLATPAALAFLWESLKNDSLLPTEKLSLIKRAEQMLGLTLLDMEAPSGPIPAEVQELVKKREEARKNKDFTASDTLRIHIRERGYHVEDTASGPVLSLLKG